MSVPRTIEAMFGIFADLVAESSGHRLNRSSTDPGVVKTAGATRSLLSPFRGRPD